MLERLFFVTPNILIRRRDGHSALKLREPCTTLGNRGRIIRAPLEKRVTRWSPKRSWAVMGASSATGAAVDLRQLASAICVGNSRLCEYSRLRCCHWLQGKSAKTERPTKLVTEGKGAKTKPLLFRPTPSLSTSVEVTPCSYSQRHLYSSTREPRLHAWHALQHPFAIIPELTNPLSLSKIHGCCLLRDQAFFTGRGASEPRR